MPENTTIALSKETKERLTKLGRKGQKYDDILKSLIEFYTEFHDKSKQEK